MAKKKNIKQADLMSLYMDYVLTHNQQPKSVYSFSKDNNFEEQKFYEHFNSFDALEKSIFKAFFDNTHDVLQKSEDYQSFDARNKLLSFYYTFFEVLTANRSYVIYALENKKNKLKTLKTLSSLKSSFTKYVSTLDIKTLDLKEEKLEKLQKRSIEESAWIQLLMTIKFWIDDTSKAFEKTDVFIEKSVNTSFDLIDTTPLKSLIDFGKFIYKEKFKMNA
ncbi:MAG: heat-shock protein [Flavobacteriaceae bacterium]|nr:heat-shock protein [Flavobacteriaceae bacterium]|tara:strand:+ start:1703 stop:2362 length:660 start_codon:yes stop_codon:yes gene_type:complete